MAVFSRDAQGILDRYLHRLRASLRGHTSVDVDDVERDVQSHIAAALSGQPEPIDARSLRQVLDQLGSPEQWVPDDDLPTWRRVLLRLRSGPEDWRLAYLTFICFLAGLTLFLAPVESEPGVPRGPLLWPLPIVLVLASFVLARASLAVLAAHGESIETRRWLIYPPLLLWYTPALLVLLAWPVALAVVATEDSRALREWIGSRLSTSDSISIAVAAAVALGTWWIALGLLIGRFRSVVRTSFWPFAEWVGRRHAIGVMVAGGSLLAAVAVVVTVFN